MIAFIKKNYITMFELVIWAALLCSVLTIYFFGLNYFESVVYEIADNFVG